MRVGWILSVVLLLLPGGTRDGGDSGTDSFFDDDATLPLAPTYAHRTRWWSTWSVLGVGVFAKWLHGACCLSAVAL